MSKPGMWLEIRRGKTNFPLRPISGERFLIGAGSHCHLQLGGDHVPMLHSLLVIEGPIAHLEAVVAEPPLVINGHPCRMTELQDGDNVVIGEFEFVFHRLASSEPAANAAVADCGHSRDSQGFEDLSQLSASELVELIEQEARQISEFNRQREHGATALLDAALRAGGASHPASVPIAAYRRTEIVTDAEEQPASGRESEFLRRSREIKEAQAALAAQMAEFAELLSSWETADRPPSLRATA